jgi:serine phosphatase RsbU (regulator of sigma subunit)
LLVYSDGITEAVDAFGQQFGLDRLIRFVQAAKNFPIQESLDDLMHIVKAWSQPTGLQDDASCLAVQTVVPNSAWTGS